MNLTHSIVEVQDELVALLKGQVFLSYPLYQVPDATSAVFYGDTDQIPGFPAITVSPAPKTRDEYETGHRWQILLASYVNIYYGKVQGGGLNEREENLLAEEVEDFLNIQSMPPNKLKTDAYPNGMVIYGKIIRSEPTVRRDVMLRVQRLTWQGESRQDH